MENIVLDPSKSNNTNIIYKGPVDNIYRGSPILSKGFLNMECNNNKDSKNYNYFYKSYFNSWNYSYQYSEELEELAPRKNKQFFY
jgi:hypothetical protein